MTSFQSVSTHFRVSGEDKKSVCSLNGIAPDVTPAAAVAFADAIETLHNNGPCTAQLRLVLQIDRDGDGE